MFRHSMCMSLGNTRIIFPGLKEHARRFAAVAGEPSRVQKLAKLSDRKIIRIKGTDSTKYLQGILTVDMESFADEGRRSAYTMLLNSQGRVLFDALIYAVPGESNHYFLEADESALSDIIKHLKMYKLRAKVEVEDGSKEFEPWVLFSENTPICMNASSNKDIIADKDPRSEFLGMRMIVPWNKSPVDIIKIGDHVPVGSAVYKEQRYKLGIAEGLDEIPSGSALPLEYNLALLKGVSFSKGCYIGQELTARSHHVGQIRKRVMPLQLDIKEKIKNYPEFAPDTVIKTDKGKSAGRLAVMSGQYGLGLIRLKELNESSYLCMNDKNNDQVLVTAKIPKWWPRNV